MTNTNPNLKLKYEGSVKNVFADANNEDNLWFSFTDKYSVFDWGQMPDLIKNKGRALALIGAYIFDKLSQPHMWQGLPQSTYLKKFDPIYLQKRFTHPAYSGPSGLKEKGLPSHFIALYKTFPLSTNGPHLKELLTKCNPDGKTLEINIKNEDELLLQVLAAQVFWPQLKNIMGENIYFYPPITESTARRLVPLEVVFSFGLLEGSSLKRKLDEEPNYIKVLGLSNLPKVNQWFAQPTLQFFTKLEAKDRLLTWQEAAVIAQLNANQFEQLVELSLDIALALHALFASCNLELWDGKLEFILDQESNQLLLADSVGPDEVRLLYQGVHLSKEILRQFYRPSAWYKTLPQAREIAARAGDENWQDICREQLKQSPEPLPVDIKALVNQLYPVITNQIFSQAILPDQPGLDNFTTELEKTLSKYKKAEHKHKKEGINA